MWAALVNSTATGADILQLLFLLSVIVLAIWKAFWPLDLVRWKKWLRLCLLIGACGGLLRVIDISIPMIQEYTTTFDEYEEYALINRLTGPYALIYWSRPVATLLMSALLFVARKRSSWWIGWTVALLFTIPAARWIIIITSLHRDYVPSSWTFLHETHSYLIAPFTLLLSAALMLWAQRRSVGAKSNRMN